MHRRWKIRFSLWEVCKLLDSQKRDNFLEGKQSLP